MDARDTQTYNAALRVLKSKLRHGIYTQRQRHSSTWANMLALEDAILSEAQDNWKRVCATWDLSDALTRVKLNELIQDALDRSLVGVTAMFDDLTGDVSIEALRECSQQPGWMDLLPEVSVCKSATS